MIAADLDASRVAASQLSDLVEQAGFVAGTEEACRRLLQTSIDPDFPGALIPDRSPRGELSVIAAARPTDWRRLSPVLRAFAGPTLTSFDGLPSTHPPRGGLAGILSGLGPYTTATLRLPIDPGGRSAALRALVRASDTFARAPRLTRSAPEPTSWLLARFQDHLNIGRRDAAEAVIARLRDELRLDALNLKALQVQLFATFEDWAAIVALPGFANLTVARRTPTTTSLLLEALYRTHLAALFDSGEIAKVEQAYAAVVRPLALPMLTLPAATSLRGGGWRLFGLEALVSPERADLRSIAGSKASELGWIAGRLAPVSTGPVPATAPIDEARELVVATQATESVDVMAAALAALARLNEEQRRELARAEPFRSAVRALELESGSAVVPTSWANWLTRLADPAFTNALDLARSGAEEWPIGSEANDPVKVKALLDGLNAAQADEVATERTAQALPYLVAALRQDPAFPNPALASIYSSLLTLLAMNGARGGAVYQSSQVLVDALLAVGTDTSRYRELIADVEELAGEGFGIAMVYWTLELIEAFMRAAAPDMVARERFIHGILARITPIRNRLSSLQREAVKRLAEEFGWTLNGFDADVESDAGDEVVSQLQGKKIAIYSLSENASRQAKETLEGAVADLKVECSADHGGSTRLRALTVNSDLIIIAWAAAKHAATDFIREHRGSKPLIYAEGKGASSILRAAENYFKLTRG